MLIKTNVAVTVLAEADSSLNKCYSRIQDWTRWRMKMIWSVPGSGDPDPTWSVNLVEELPTFIIYFCGNNSFPPIMHYAHVIYSFRFKLCQTKRILKLSPMWMTIYLEGKCFRRGKNDIIKQWQMGVVLSLPPPYHLSTVPVSHYCSSIVDLDLILQILKYLFLK